MTGGKGEKLLHEVDRVACCYTQTLILIDYGVFYQNQGIKRSQIQQLKTLMFLRM